MALMPDTATCCTAHSGLRGTGPPTHLHVAKRGPRSPPIAAWGRSCQKQTFHHKHKSHAVLSSLWKHQYLLHSSHPPMTPLFLDDVLMQNTSIIKRLFDAPPIRPDLVLSVCFPRGAKAEMTANVLPSVFGLCHWKLFPPHRLQTHGESHRSKATTHHCCPNTAI